jgi:hypothetical protein
LGKVIILKRNPISLVEKAGEVRGKTGKDQLKKWKYRCG